MGVVEATRDALLSALTEQRRHVLGILDGLDDADLRRTSRPAVAGVVVDQGAGYPRLPGDVSYELDVVGS